MPPNLEASTIMPTSLASLTNAKAFLILFTTLEQNACSSSSLLNTIFAHFSLVKIFHIASMKLHLRTSARFYFMVLSGLLRTQLIAGFIEPLSLQMCFTPKIEAISFPIVLFLQI